MKLIRISNPLSILLILSSFLCSGCATLPDIDLSGITLPDISTTHTPTDPQTPTLPTPAPVAAPLRITLTSDPAAVASLTAQGAVVGLCVERNAVGTAAQGNPAFVILRPDPKTFRLGQQANWIPVCNWARATYPNATLGWCGSGDTHPTYWRLLVDCKQDVPRWFLDCSSLSKDEACSAIAKLGGYYGPRQGKGYKVIAVNAPDEAAAIKAGAIGVAR